MLRMQALCRCPLTSPARLLAMNTLAKAMFVQVGWPTAIPTKEHRQFVYKLHALKQEALKRMVEAGAIPIRPGERRLLWLHFT